MYRMASWIVFLLLLALASASAGDKPFLTPPAPDGLARAAAAVKEAPTLTFTQEGNDLVVRTRVTVNNSRHVLWTRAFDLGPKVVLHYFVFQNTDLFVRSQKQVTVEWRLPGMTKEGKEFQVHQTFQPNTADLRALLPQLQELIDAGAKFGRSIQPTTPEVGEGKEPLPTFADRGRWNEVIQKGVWQQNDEVNLHNRRN